MNYMTELRVNQGKQYELYIKLFTSWFSLVRIDV